MARFDIRTVDIRRAAVPEGGVPPYGTSPLMVKCPKHADDSESLAIFPDHIYCMGCPFRIQKRMDALAWLLKLKDWKEALAVAPKYTFLKETERQKLRQSAKPRRKPLAVDVDVYAEVLEDVCADRKEWLLSRGLSDETIRTARLGHNGAAFVIPVFDGNHEVVTLRYRNDEEICGKYETEYDDNLEVVKQKKIPKYRGWAGCNDAVLYPAWKFESDRSDYIVLVEGEFDALLLWQCGVPAITATNGAGQQGLVLELLKRYFDSIRDNPRRRPTPKQVVICGDRDGPGIIAARALFERAKQEYAEVVWLQWPAELGKDITELMQKGYSFGRICETWGYLEEVTEDRAQQGHGADTDAERSSERATPDDRPGREGHDSDASGQAELCGNRATEARDAVHQACSSEGDLAVRVRPGQAAA